MNLYKKSALCSTGHTNIQVNTPTLYKFHSCQISVDGGCLGYNHTGFKRNCQFTLSKNLISIYLRDVAVTECVLYSQMSPERRNDLQTCGLSHSSDTRWVLSLEITPAHQYNKPQSAYNLSSKNLFLPRASHFTVLRISVSFQSTNGRFIGNNRVYIYNFF